MAVATLGAMALAIYESASGSGEGDYTEAIAVMLFYQIGEWFQSYAVGKSRRNISDLMDICPDYANIENENGEIEEVDPDEVEIGTVILVKPGEKIPIDGIVVEGKTSVDTAALTGESVPRDVKPGDEVISGCINLSGFVKVKTTKEFGESAVSQILDLVENASSRKSRSENFITRFARVYTPAVVFSAIGKGPCDPNGTHGIQPVTVLNDLFFDRRRGFVFVVAKRDGIDHPADGICFLLRNLMGRKKLSGITVITGVKQFRIICIM
jgi:Cd2+/Zn2+-exporting ATPase